VRRFLAIGVVLVVAAGALLWWWVHRPSDRQLVDELIARAVHGVETKSLDEIMGCVSPGYHDEEGLSKLDVWRGAARFVQSPDTAEVSIEDYTLDIAPPKATGVFRVRVVILQNGQYLNLGPMEMTVEFEKRRRRLRQVWLVKSVSAEGIDRLMRGYM
jgi:hypothetical protein